MAEELKTNKYKIMAYKMKGFSGFKNSPMREEKMTRITDGEGNLISKQKDNKTSETGTKKNVEYDLSEATVSGAGDGEKRLSGWKTHGRVAKGYGGYTNMTPKEGIHYDKQTNDAVNRWIQERERSNESYNIKDAYDYFSGSKKPKVWAKKKK